MTTQQQIYVPSDDSVIPNNLLPTNKWKDNFFTFVTKVVANFNALFANGGGAAANQYTADTHTAGFTATGAEMASARENILDLTGALAGAANVQSDTAANIIAAIPNAAVGTSVGLRIVNNSSGAFAWTLTAGTGVTLTGTMSVAQHTFRDFLITVTGAAAVTIQNIGSGTN